MSEVGANTPANHFGGSFGPNEWLVQEMYERYQSDPSSVDKAWWDFFADFKGNSSLNGAVISSTPATKPGTPPIPKSQLAKPAPAAAVVVAPVVIAPVVVEKVEPDQLINSLSMICPFSVSEKQGLLEAKTLIERNLLINQIINFYIIGNNPGSERQIH